MYIVNMFECYVESRMEDFNVKRDTGIIAALTRFGIDQHVSRCHPIRNCFFSLDAHCE